MLEDQLDAEFLDTLIRNKKKINNYEYDLLALIESAPSYIRHVPYRLKRSVIHKYKEGKNEAPNTAISK